LLSISSPVLLLSISSPVLVAFTPVGDVGLLLPAELLIFLLRSTPARLSSCSSCNGPPGGAVSREPRRRVARRRSTYLRCVHLGGGEEEAGFLVPDQFPVVVLMLLHQAHVDPHPLLLGGNVSHVRGQGGGAGRKWRAQTHLRTRRASVIGRSRGNGPEAQLNQVRCNSQVGLCGDRNQLFSLF